MTIETAAIVWAVLATGGAAVVYLLMRRECRALDEAGYRQFVRALEAETELGRIKYARHLSAKRARAAQLAQQRAAVLAKAHEVAAQVERREA